MKNANSIKDPIFYNVPYIPDENLIGNFYSTSKVLYRSIY